MFYRVVIAGSTSSAFRAAFPDLEHRAVGRPVKDGATDTAPGAASNTVLEGPVLDAAQLAGILSDICHRNGKIIRVELMTSEWEA